MKDAFDTFWRWADKPLDSYLALDSTIHHAVTKLDPAARRDRGKVNTAVGHALRRKSPRRRKAPRA